MEGFIIAFAVMGWALAFGVLIGRWVTADENWLGVLVRSFLLLVLFVLAFTHFHTVWCWVCMGLVVVPLVDDLGLPVAPRWLKRRREARLSEALGQTIVRPDSPFTYLHLGQAYLEAGQVEAGLAELARAEAMGDEESRSVITELTAQAREEWLRTCPRCGHPNLRAALACRHCLRVLTPGLLPALLVACAWPVLRWCGRRVRSTA